MWYLLLCIVFVFSSCSSSNAPSAPSSPQVQNLDSHSQASQDQFVYILLYELLNKQNEGYYLEIGAGHPSEGNNTYIFEKKFKWKGASIDLATQETWYSSRENPLIIEDATQFEYGPALKAFPQSIDYLSLDIDDNYNMVLKKIPFDKYIFNVITIEHDFYRYGDKFRAEERMFLSSLGYYLLCPDVSISIMGKECTFEDWWIHPSAFSVDLIAELVSLDLNGKNHKQLVNTLHKFTQRYVKSTRT